MHRRSSDLFFYVFSKPGSNSHFTFYSAFAETTTRYLLSTSQQFPQSSSTQEPERENLSYPILSYPLPSQHPQQCRPPKTQKLHTTSTHSTHPAAPPAYA